MTRPNRDERMREAWTDQSCARVATRVTWLLRYEDALRGARRCRDNAARYRREWMAAVDDMRSAMTERDAERARADAAEAEPDCVRLLRAMTASERCVAHKILDEAGYSVCADVLHWAAMRERQGR